MTGDELDTMVDALRAELETARPALLEADRLGRAGDFPVPTVLTCVDEGAWLGGAYEPRWRGVARPLADSPTGRLTVAGDLLITREKTGLLFRSLQDGTPIHTFVYPWPEAARPYAGDRVEPSFESPKSRGLARPFADDHGPGVLTVDVGGRGPRLWRVAGAGWRAVALVRPGLLLRPSARRVTMVAAEGGTCRVWYRDGVSFRFDSRTGAPAGEADPGPYVWPRVRYLGQGRARYAFTEGFGSGSVLCRVDVETGAEVGAPIRVGRMWGCCAYQVGGRPYLAVTGFRQVHRFDAETGEPAGPPLFGHRRIVLDVVPAVVDGRAVLYSADGATVRRWDAETGTPWPAPVP